MKKQDPIPRAPGVTDRMVALGLGGRFFDELMSGLPQLIMPTLRQTLGLSFEQIGLLDLTLNYVSAIVEPINGILIDFWPRRRLMAFGALGAGLSIIIVGIAPSFGWLLLAYAIYGIASGPLAHTGDVVLVEMHPKAADRIYARSTFVDTIGALLPPVFVAITFGLNWNWHYLLISLGSSSIIYATLLNQTKFPEPASSVFARAKTKPISFTRQTYENIRTVLQTKKAMKWLSFLILYELLELPFLFSPIWLAENVGMSQGLIGIYKMVEIIISLISLALLERILVETANRSILLISTTALLIFFPAWLLIPGIWSKFILMIPLTFFASVYWPIAKGESLRAVPGKIGAIVTVNAIFNFLPFGYFFGKFAENATLPTSMMLIGTGSIVTMFFFILLFIPNQK